MEKQFVTHEIANQLKELGFNKTCLAVFVEDYNFELSMFGQRFDHKIETNLDFIDDIKENDVLAPLWQQAIDYLRHAYKIHISIFHNTEGYSYTIVNINNKTQVDVLLFSSVLESMITGVYYHNYEDARISAIFKAIELIKSKIK